MSALAFKLLLLGISVVPGPCPEDPTLGGCTRADWNVVYVQPSAPPETRWHELGHQLDIRVLTPEDRRQFGALLRNTRAWDEGRFPLREQFAEAVASCIMPPWRQRLWSYGYYPSRRLRARVCQWLNRVAQR